MDEEVAVDNVNRSNEEKIKLKKKDKKSKKSAMAAEEAHNVDTVKAAESARFSESEDISGVKRHHKRVKQKKRTKKSKGGEDAEADMKNGSREAELSGVLGENVAGQKMDSAAEGNCESSSGLTMDSAAERKKSRREKKDKKKKPEMQDTEEVKRDDNANWQEGEIVSGKESAKEVLEENKKRKVKGNDSKAGGKDGEVIEMHSDNCIVNNVTDIRKETKKDKKKSKDRRFVGSKDTSNDTKFDGVDLSSKQQEHVPQDVEHPTQRTQEDGNTNTNHERKKKKHKKKEKSKDDILAAQQDNVDNENNGLLNTKESQNNEAGLTSKRKKKKSKCTENGSNDDQENEAEYANKGKKRKSSLMVNGSDGTSLNKSNKKVRFSDQDEVFTLPTNLNTEKANGVVDNLVRGKRFTPEEDKIVKDAVLRYIEENELGDEGLEMVLNCSKHRNLKGCWNEIASAIPYRPYLSVYRRAQVLLTRPVSQTSTLEERQIVLEHQKKHGNKWKALADELGKDRLHVRELWRRIKLPNLNKGNWSQEEYQRLFDLVNTDLQLKLSEEKKSRYGMLRDNICWTAISDTHSTRAMWACCTKWYGQLTSSMAAKGVWSDSDDYRLLCALYSLDATCLEDVDWDDLIDNRPGEVCRKRWNQMVLHIGHNRKKSFAEQVEVLAQRYCPHLLEARVIWDNKPRVP